MQKTVVILHLNLRRHSTCFTKMVQKLVPKTAISYNLNSVTPIYTVHKFFLDLFETISQYENMYSHANLYLHFNADRLRKRK